MGWQDDTIVNAAPKAKAPWESDPVVNAPSAQPSLTAGDIASGVNTGVNWLGTQLTKGVTGLLGTPRAIGETNQAVANWAGEKLGAPETGKAVGSILRYITPFPGAAMGPRSEDLNRGVFQKLGVPEVNAGDNPALTIKPPALGGGSINLGKMLDVGAQAIPAVMAGPSPVGSAIRQGITTIVPAMTSGVGSELAGQAAQGAEAGPGVEAIARILGGAGGYMAGNRAISPLPANLTPEEARNVATAQEKGVPLSVGQETGRLRNFESAVSRMPGGQGPFENLREQQAIGTQRAALGEIGASGERTDPTTMARVYGEKSAEFNAAKNASGNVALDKQFYTDLNDVVNRYNLATPASGVVPSVGKSAADFAKSPVAIGASGNPELTGAQYQAFRKNINDAAQATSDAGAKNALKDMRGALDRAMEASLPADQAEAWRTVRQHWAGLKTLLKATSSGTVSSRAEGNLSPNALSAALRQSQGPDKFATTTGGLNDIARMGGYLADTIPNSGTPQTLNMQNVVRALLSPAGAGGAVGSSVLGPVIGAPAGIAAGVASTNALARALTGGYGAGWLRDYLANQAAQQNRSALGIGALEAGQAAGRR